MGNLLFPQPLEHNLPQELALEVGALQLVGTSVAARATAFALPQWGLALDVGRLTPTLLQQGTLLLSHAHLDHAAGLLAYLNLRARWYPRQPTTLWVPAAIRGSLLQALRLFPGMDSVAKRLPLEEVLCPAEDGQEISLSGLRLRAFAVDHSVPTLGWSIALKGEEQPRLVFAADGDPRQFRQRPELLRAQVAVVECTYVEENRRVAARLSQHAHLWDWVELAPSIPAKTLVLAHLPETLPPLSHFRPLQAAFPGDLVLWTSPVAGKKGSLARP